MFFNRTDLTELATIESGFGIRIAIPQTAWCPLDGTPEELRQWFLDSLPDIPAELLGEVSTLHVWCHLFNRGGAERSLAATVGEIVDADKSSQLPCYSMRVVMGVIGNGERLTRWPGGEIVFARADR